MAMTQRSGVSIHYELEGSGPPLVLLHGAFADSETWRVEGYVDELRSDFRLVLPDLRGHGQSAKPHEPAAYLLADQVSDAIAVLDELDIPTAFFCGFSQGAVVATALAGRRPDRMSAVLTLGLASCNLGFEDVRREPAFDWADEFLTEGMAVFVRMAKEAGRPAWATMHERQDPLAMWALLHADDIDVPVPGLRLCEVAAPMTCIWGGGDLPKVSLPLPTHAEIVVIPGEDHVGTLDHTEVVIPLLRSLASRVPPAAVS